MVGIRRLIPFCLFFLTTGFVLAADIPVVGTVEKYDKKSKAFAVRVPIKGKKDKFETQYFRVEEKTAIIDEKGNDLKPGDLENRKDKPVTLFIRKTKPKVGNVLEVTLAKVDFGKDALKAEDKDKKVVVAAKDKKPEAKDKKPEMKKDDGKATPKSADDGKGQEAKIVSVDAGKGELIVEISGAKKTIKVEKDTRFTGPRGGDRGEGPKVLEEESKEGEVLHMPAGKLIRVVYDTVKDKTRLKEIVLPLNVKE